MSGRKRDSVWQYFNARKGEKSIRVTCKTCGKDMQGLVARMKSHLSKCVPEPVADEESFHSMEISLVSESESK